jgi:hypothetical protein
MPTRSSSPERKQTNLQVDRATTDLKALLQHYQIEDPEDIDRILALARISRDQQAWWAQYTSLDRQYQELLGYETSASLIQTFQPSLIPGQLQNEDYARAVLSASAPSRVDELLEVRMRRQEELFGLPELPEMFFVIDEAVLRRWVGGKEVMARQLRRLKNDARKEKVTIEVVPFREGAYPGIGGPFVILEFRDERDEDVLFLENSRGDILTRDELADILPYKEIFARLRDLAKDVDLEAMIDDVLEQMAKQEG